MNINLLLNLLLPDKCISCFQHSFRIFDLKVDVIAGFAELEESEIRVACSYAMTSLRSFLLATSTMQFSTNLNADWNIWLLDRDLFR
jgi:hypothetical protein